MDFPLIYNVFGGERMKKKRRAVILAALGLYLFFLVNPFQLSLPKLLYVNTTASLPMGIYLAIPGVGIRDGDIVAYEQEPQEMENIRRNGWLPEGADPVFIKRAAIEGGSYSVSPSDHLFRVNGHIIGTAMTGDGKGHVLYPRYGVFLIGDGAFLPYTRAARSYDGRYTGTVSTARIYSRIIPLLTR